MNLIRRAVLIILLAGFFAQPAYSMDFITIARIIEYIRPHATKIGWYGVNKAGWFLIGNGPVIAATSWIVYVYVKRCLIDKLQRDLGEVKEDVKGIKKNTEEIKGKVDTANQKLEEIGNKQTEHGVILNALQGGQGQQDEQLEIINTNVSDIKKNQQGQGEQLEYLTKGHAENQEALLSLLNSEDDIKKGLEIVDKKIDEIAVTLNNDRAKSEDQEKAFNDLITQQTELYKAVGQLQANGRLQSSAIFLEITALDDKIDKAQTSYITRMDRIEDEIKKYKEESNKRFEEQSQQLKNQAKLLEEQKKQISGLREEFATQLAALKEDLKDRDDKLMKYLENNKQDLTTSFTKLREDIDRDNKTNIATAVASIRNSNVKALPSNDSNDLPIFGVNNQQFKTSGKILGALNPTILNSNTQNSSIWNLQEQRNPVIK